MENAKERWRIAITNSTKLTFQEKALAMTLLQSATEQGDHLVTTITREQIARRIEFRGKLRRIRRNWRRGLPLSRRATIPEDQVDRLKSQIVAKGLIRRQVLRRKTNGRFDIPALVSVMMFRDAWLLWDEQIETERGEYKSRSQKVL